MKKWLLFAIKLVLTAESGSGQVTSGTYDDQDRLLTYGDFEYEWNARGQLELQRNTTTGEETTYEYDEFGGLRSVGLPDGRTISYAIDAAGRRIARYVDGAFDRGWLYADGINPVALGLVNFIVFHLARGIGNVYRTVDQ